MEVVLTRSQRVLRLYRHALQQSRSWEVNRQLWRKQALTIRARLEEHRNETNYTNIEKILTDAEVRNVSLCADILL